MLDTKADASVMEASTNPDAIKTGHVVADDWSANWNGSVAIKITALVVWIVVTYSFIITIGFFNGEVSELEEIITFKSEHVVYEFALNNYHPDNKSNLEDLNRSVINHGFLAARVLYKEDEEWIGTPLDKGKIKELASITQLLSIPGSRDPEITLELFHLPLKQLAQREIINTLILVALSIFGFGFTHVFITSRVLKRPFQALEEASRRVINGDLAIRMDTYRQDEFGRLAIFFNSMLDRIQSDNTELKETLESLQNTQDKLMQSQKDANAANEAKSLFLANMSHEIRTPMNAILGYTQILQGDSSLGDDQQTSIEAIGRSGDHLLGLINNILDLSKIEAGRMELNPVDFSINDLIHDLSEMFRLHCQKHQLTWSISTNIDSDVYVVRGDEGKLKQVLINLLSNAVKFTVDGGVALSLTKNTGNLFTFEVIDTGPGIKESSLKTIFDIFQQDEQGRKMGGTGLGLPICKNQIELMGGKLEVDSTLGQGSRFYFSLSLPSAEKYIPKKTKMRKIPGLAAGQHIKALVVDDTPANNALLAKILADIGAEVRQAEDGSSAIIIAKQFQPDIIFMDYNMPEMNGLEAASKIKGIVKKPFKTIMVTAASFDINTPQFRAANIDYTVTKPFRIEDIIFCLLIFLDAIFEDDASIIISEDDTSIALIKNNAGSPGAENFTSIKVPPEIIEQLKEAAEFNLVTALENISSQINQLGDEYHPLSKKLQHLIRSFDIPKIKEIAEGLSSE